MSVRKPLHTLLSALLGGGLMLGAGNALAEYGLNLRPGVTPISRDIYDLHMLIFWICVAIAVLVFGAVFYSIFAHRKSKGAVAAQFHESTTIEIIWTIIPFVILIGMAIPATKVLIAMEDVSNSDLSIKVTGFQWKWKYDYLDDGISFFSTLSKESNEARILKSGVDVNQVENYLLDVDNPVVVPINKKVRLLITANDVIHAWWVPDLGMKKDAIPGFVNEMWFNIDKPGVYRGQCAELCGKDHGFMPIVVIAKTEEEYQQWVADQKAAQAASAEDPNKVWGLAELVSKGEAVYNANCAACHQANGEGVPGTFPAIKGSAIATGPVAEHIDIVVKGKPGTAMSAFGPQLSDTDLAAVITYQRNAFGNDTGNLVQPSEVKAAR